MVQEMGAGRKSRIRGGEGGEERERSRITGGGERDRDAERERERERVREREREREGSRINGARGEVEVPGAKRNTYTNGPK